MSFSVIFSVYIFLFSLGCHMPNSTILTIKSAQSVLYSLAECLFSGLHFLVVFLGHIFGHAFSLSFVTCTGFNILWRTVLSLALRRTGKRGGDGEIRSWLALVDVIFVSNFCEMVTPTAVAWTCEYHGFESWCSWHAGLVFVGR